MKEVDVGLVLQRAVEKYSTVKPRVISDNGPAVVARDFRAYVPHLGVDHVRTSSYYMRSNGKIKRANKTQKSECIHRRCF
jgi:transposase InsO family protein